jgi:hypothetical protein
MLLVGLNRKKKTSVSGMLHLTILVGVRAVRPSSAFMQLVKASRRGGLNRWFGMLENGKTRVSN